MDAADWDDDSEFDEWDDADELYAGDELYADDDETITVDCPNCGAAVYEDAPQCPACGWYVTHSTSAWQGRPVWWILIGVAGVIATILLLLPG